MTHKTVDILKHFIGRAQLKTLMILSNQSEEAQYYHKLTAELADKLEKLPRVYEQDGKGKQAIAHLHYFKGGADWYITERDITLEQLQAFGLADLGYGPELGYISLQELGQNGVELDLHWTPKTLAEISK